MEIVENQYAGFWLRLVAYLIDSIIISFVEFLLVLPLMVLLGLSAAFDGVNFDHIEPEIFFPMLISAGLGFYLTAFLTTWLYFALLESGPRQATIGKMALGIRVTDLNGNRISFSIASLRYFGKILSNAIFMIGYIMAGFTQRKQALHDIIASTLVIRD